MRICVLSDLHLEFQRSHWRGFVAHLPRDCDVLVLAGDICAFDMIEDVLAMFGRLFPQVVYVLGNHEYYATSPTEMNYIFRANAKIPDNVEILHRSAKVIAGQRFVGCTMWFRHVPGAPCSALSDFDFIHEFSPWVYEENARDVAFLNANVRAGDVVVTHHLPSQRSVHRKYAGSPYNSFFVCEVDDAIESFRPALWIHGHTHSSVDYTLDETRVVANPYGYFGHETNDDFDAGKTIEVGEAP
jgi:Icc-related predicted phosphoesterase